VAEFDVDAFLQRFRDRAEAVKERGIPPLEYDARRAFIRQAELDYQDYSIVGAADWSVEEDCLLLRIPLSAD
jgi:hypothetical protein